LLEVSYERIKLVIKTPVNKNVIRITTLENVTPYDFMVND
jgi:hypothetical protein